jgi:hypothetical protein
METRADACQHRYSGSFKRAHIGGFASALIAYAALTISKLTNYPADQLTWNTVAFFPLVVYAIVFAGMVSNFARAMKRARTLDDAENLPVGSVPPQS